MDKIRIITKAGKMIERKANVIDWIDQDGKQSATAMVGKTMYKVIDRDFYGPIFGRK